MIFETIVAAVIIGVGVGGYWLGWTHAKEQQADIDLIDRFEKAAIEYGKQNPS